MEQILLEAQAFAFGTFLFAAFAGPHISAIGFDAPGAAARLACARPRVGRKVFGFERSCLPRPVVGATRHRAVKRALAAVIENEFPVREFQDAIDGFGDAGARVLADNNAVHDDEKFLRNNLAFGFREVGERVGHAVGHRAGEPLRQEHRRKFVEARAAGGEGGEKLQLAPLRQPRNFLDDFFAARAFHGLAAYGASGFCESREQCAQCAVAFRKAQRIRFCGCFPVACPDGEACRQSFRAIQRDNPAAAQEFRGEGGECFQIAPLRFPVQGIKYQS